MSRLTDRLEQLEELWVQKGCDEPLLGLASPCPPGVIRSTLALAGLPAPREVVEWFSWRNGCRGGFNREVRLVPSNQPPLSLQEALAEREGWLVGAEKSAELTGDVEPGWEAPSFWWEPTWLPLMSEGLLVIDLGSSENGDVAVRQVFWDDPEYSRKVLADSLSEVVDVWIDILKNYWRPPMEGAESWDIPPDYPRRDLFL